jgi:hypothetical protein
MKEDADPNDMPVIYRYTRAQAIADGVLVDLSPWAKETGFKIPLACTEAVWNGYIVPAEELRPAGQSERGRAHDLLWMLYVAIRKCPKRTDQVCFQTLFLMSPHNTRTIDFKAVCGPGDDGEPVLTVMLPDED